MTAAWLFPGQDAFESETGMDLPATALGARLSALVDELHGAPVSTPAARRRAGRFESGVVQALLAATCLAEAEARWCRGERPGFVAGASLGAVLAWGFASGVAAEALVRLAYVRGDAMAAAAREHPGGMVAVDRAKVEVALERGGAVGRIVVASRNSADGYVLSGDQAAIRAIAHLGRPLPVSGAWHSPLLAGAVRTVATAIESVEVGVPRSRWIDDGVEPTTLAEARVRLVAAIVGPIDWFASLVRLQRLGASPYRVLGPGRVVAAQVRGVVGVEARWGRELAA